MKPAFLGKKCNNNIIIIIQIQNISPFLIDSNHTHNSSWPATVDQIWKKFAILKRWRQKCSKVAGNR